MYIPNTYPIYVCMYILDIDLSIKTNFLSKEGHFSLFRTFFFFLLFHIRDKRMGCIYYSKQLSLSIIWCFDLQF